MTSYYAVSSKPRKVKPILKKFSQSEKNSLDLDRPVSEQDDFCIGAGPYEYTYGTNPRTSHDIVFANSRRGGYHNRSTSGTSQFSTATTTSGYRATGTFVHPFQQIPRPFTPPHSNPASYSNSLRDSEYSNPTLPEDEDLVRRPPLIRNSSSNRSSSIACNNPIVTHQPLLRLQTKHSTSRLALATSTTSLNNTSSLSPDYSSPIDTMSPSSLRTSMDKGFRIRSHSGVDSPIRQETIQEARRKFQEKEMAKEEKAAREEVRAMEKRNQKEAREIERRHRHSSASEGARIKRSKSDLTTTGTNEKAEDMFGRDYNSLHDQSPPFMAECLDDAPRRVKKESTKRKTHSAWTKLMMWLRTRFLRIGGRFRR